MKPHQMAAQRSSYPFQALVEVMYNVCLVAETAQRATDNATIDAHLRVEIEIVCLCRQRILSLTVAVAVRRRQILLNVFPRFLLRRRIWCGDPPTGRLLQLTKHLMGQ